MFKPMSTVKKEQGPGQGSVFRLTLSVVLCPFVGWISHRWPSGGSIDFWNASELRPKISHITHNIYLYNMGIFIYFFKNSYFKQILGFFLLTLCELRYCWPLRAKRFFFWRLLLDFVWYYAYKQFFFFIVWRLLSSTFWFLG